MAAISGTVPYDMKRSGQSIAGDPVLPGITALSGPDGAKERFASGARFSSPADSPLRIENSVDVSIRKTSSLRIVHPGEMITFVLSIANQGPDIALNCTITDEIPPYLSSPEYSRNLGAAYQPWTGSLSVGNLAPGTITIFLRALYNGSAPGAVTNTATISTSSEDRNPDNNTSTIVIPVSSSADLSIRKTASPDPALIGQPLLYTLEITNNGWDSAAGVQLSDKIPPALLNPVFSSDNGSTWQPWAEPYAIGDLPDGQTRTILIRGTVAGNTSAPISNTAAVSSNTPDPNPENNTSSVETPVSEAADLSIQKTGSPDPVAPGGTLTYSVTIRNAGPSDARDVTLFDTLPAPLTNAQLSLDGGTAWEEWQNPYAMGGLPANTEKNVLIRAAVPPSAGSPLINTAVVDSTTPDPDPANNTASDRTEVSAAADLSIRKQAGCAQAAPGEAVLFTLSVCNAGPSPAGPVTVSDWINGAEYSLNNGLNWEPWPGSVGLPRLMAGQCTAILLRAAAPDGVSEFSNTASVASPVPDPDPSNNASSIVIPVEPYADLSISKTACPCEAVPGQYLYYTLTARNAGPSAAHSVRIMDTVPDALSRVQFSVNHGRSWMPWTGSYHAGTLATGASASIMIAGLVSRCASGRIQNTASVASSTADRDTANNTFTSIVPVRPLCPPI